MENKCVGVIPGTFVMCGEEKGIYCSDECRLNEISKIVNTTTCSLDDYGLIESLGRFWALIKCKHEGYGKYFVAQYQPRGSVWVLGNGLSIHQDLALYEFEWFIPLESHKMKFEL